MHVATLEATPVSFPYLHREVSSQVARDGVTDIIIRIESDDGCVGWGEACSGADVGSVEAAIHAMAPFVLGSDPWNREAIQSRAVRARALAVPGRDRELRVGGHRHGARRHRRTRCRPAAVQALRRPASP